MTDRWRTDRWTIGGMGPARGGQWVFSSFQLKVTRGHIGEPLWYPSASGHKEVILHNSNTLHPVFPFMEHGCLALVFIWGSSMSLANKLKFNCSQLKFTLKLDCNYQCHCLCQFHCHFHCHCHYNSNRVIEIRIGLKLPLILTLVLSLPWWLKLQICYWIAIAIAIVIAIATVNDLINWVVPLPLQLH